MRIWKQFTAARVSVVLLAAAAIGPCATEAVAYETPPEAIARLKQFIPKTYAKLARREPVHILAVGDSVTKGFVYNDAKYSTLQMYPGVLARELAKEFFYTGGVREVDPEGENPEKLDPSRGPEITLESVARNGADILYAFSRLTTDAWDNHPDLVIINFGINDSRRGFPTSDYGAACDALAKIILERGAEPIMVAPTPTFDLDPRRDIAITHPYASIMKDVAARHGVFFADSEEILLAALYDARRAPAPSEAFNDVVEDLAKVFDHGPDVEDLVHPTPRGHQIIGKGIAKALLYGTPGSSLAPRGSITQHAERDGWTATISLKNESDEAIEGALVPLPIEHVALPENPDGVSVSVAAGKTQKFVFEYLPNTGRDFAHWMALHRMPGFERFVRVPALLATDKEARLLDIRAEIKPVAVVWDLGAFTNVADQVTLTGKIFNHTDKAMQANYRAVMGGQVVESQFTAAPGEGAPFELGFAFPGADVDRMKHEVQMVVSGPGFEHESTREVELVRNFGLGQRIPLLHAQTYVHDRPLAEVLEAPGPQVEFRAEADEKALYIVVDIKGYELQLPPRPNHPAAYLELIFDGRYYENRGTIGYSDVIMIHVPEEDGPIDIGRLRLGAFGNGYDRPLDPANVKAELSTKPDGGRRVTIVFPRTYFYLHEWALGNGNSALGINNIISFCKVTPEDPEGIYPSNLRYTLVSPGLHGMDSRSLATLELSPKPTARWSVRVY